MSNWEQLNAVEKIKVSILETIIQHTKNRTRVIKLEIEIYKTYKRALQRQQRHQRSHSL